MLHIQIKGENLCKKEDKEGMSTKEISLVDCPECKAVIKVCQSKLLEYRRKKIDQVILNKVLTENFDETDESDRERYKELRFELKNLEPKTIEELYVMELIAEGVE